MRGIIYQMPGRHGAPIFVCGYADPFNGTAGRESTNPACLSFSSIIYGESGWFSENPIDNPECADAGRLADGITESMAESEREYRRHSDARREFEECAETNSGLRADVRALIKELRGLCPTLATYPLAASALRGKLESLLETIEENRQRRAALVADFGDHDGWNDY